MKNKRFFLSILIMLTALFSACDSLTNTNYNNYKGDTWTEKTELVLTNNDKMSCSNGISLINSINSVIIRCFRGGTNYIDIDIKQIKQFYRIEQ